MVWARIAWLSQRCILFGVGPYRIFRGANGKIGLGWILPLWWRRCLSEEPRGYTPHVEVGHYRYFSRDSPDALHIDSDISAHSREPKNRDTCNQMSNPAQVIRVIVVDFMVKLGMLFRS